MTIEQTAPIAKYLFWCVSCFFHNEPTMTEKQLLQAIFFDFDGVIVDSNSIKTEAFRTMFSDYDRDTIAKVVAYHRQHGGISRVEKIRYAYQHIVNQPLTEDELARLAKRYSELVMEKVINIDMIDGVAEFLDNVLGALPIFVISGTPEDELRQIINRRKMSGYFQEILGSPIKKPVHISNLLVDYRLEPRHCVFVGDALTDFKAARQTGVAFIGIQGEVVFPEGTIVLPDCKMLKGAIEKQFTW